MRTNCPYSERMVYLPPAARQFSDEVKALRPDASIEPHGEPDGIKVIRSLSFDPETSEWLHDVLEAVTDKRIAQWVSDEDGIVVTFVADHHADNGTPFDLNLADAVLGYEDEPEPEESDSEEE